MIIEPPEHFVGTFQLPTLRSVITEKFTSG